MSIILKGCHFSLPMIPWIVKTEGLQKTFVFTNSCRYVLQNGDQSDWNKLTGFTLGWKISTNAVHDNSIRIAWRYNTETGLIELCWYVYRNGVRIYEEKNIWRVRVGDSVKVMIDKTFSGYYYVTINGIPKMIDVKFSKPKKYGWLCYPYFGGTSKAPHTITIKRK